jgi:hypothetical protein
LLDIFEISWELEQLANELHWGPLNTKSNSCVIEGRRSPHWQGASAEPPGAMLHMAESNTQIAIGEMAPSFGPFMPHK